ncbi:MAG TPA: S1C family serine protease [Casimicrobiaceae bacterium]|nr:S1C family serine protease [Casimicrobiaceae bacterium]
MADNPHWAFPSDLQPKPGQLAFDLSAALDSVVAVHAEIPEDAFTASILGTERVGNGVMIREDGLILTIGYLITEAETIWITTNDGRVVAGHPLAYDFQSGFGLVQPLGRLVVKPIARGSATSLAAGDSVYVIGRGGRAHALEAELFAKREFAGYWEYVLDEALFAAPLHPEWSGAALLDEQGRLVGIGSLYVQEEIGDETIKGNMFVPIDLLEPIEADLVNYGRAQRVPRPWLGMYTAESDGKLIVRGLVKGGPADEAGVRLGDRIVEVAGARVESLAGFFRDVWACGAAGVSVPLTLARGGGAVSAMVRSGDREDFLRKPSLQ